ncbi:MAG: ATP-binding protein [Planctomycetota bacterium]|jgi:two-component system phosphate regulon sensor histidine kinase PhoR
MRIGWVGKVVLSAAGPLLLGTGIFGWFMLQSVEDLERGRIEDALRREVTVLGSILPDWRMDPATLEPRVSKLAAEVGNRVTIVAPDGRVLADSSHDNVSAMENHGARPEVVAAKSENGVALRARYSETLGRELLYAASRIGESEAVVRVARDYRGVQEELARVTRAFWFLVAGLIVFCVVAAVVFARRVAKPVEELTRASEAVEKGHLDTRVYPTGEDELSALGHSFNRMTEQLAESLDSARSETARLGALLEGMSEGVLAIDDTEQVSFLNGNAREILGLGSESEVVGRPLFELVRDPRILSIAQMAAEKRSPREAEIVQEGPPRRTLLVHARPVGAQGPDTILVISDRSRMRRLERMRSDFVSNVSHELRTPLSSIAAAVETLEDEEARVDPETGARFVAMVKRNVVRLEALLNDILALSRLESRPETLRRVPIDLAALIRISGEELQQRAGAAGLKLHVRGERRVLVRGDAQLLRRISDNLIMNAISYTPEGGSIDVRIACNGADAVLTVEDTGIGIPHADLDRIFERFYRVDKARSRSAGGTGLGLAIVKHAVGLHDGSVVVESDVGERSRFTVRIPLADDEESSEFKETT